MNDSNRVETTTAKERRIDWRFWRMAGVVVVLGAGIGIAARTIYDGQRTESRLRDRVELLKACNYYEENESTWMPLGCLAINGQAYVPDTSGSILQACREHPELDDLWRPVDCDGHTGTNRAETITTETIAP